MILSAIIIIPSAGPGLPSYLFGPVAGVPLLIRQILELRRVGVSQVIILIDSTQRADLIQELDRHRPLVGETVIRSCWSEPGGSAAPDLKADYVLLLPVNILPSRRVYAALTDLLPPPGALSLGVGRQSHPLPAGVQSPPAVGDQSGIPRRGNLVTASAVDAASPDWPATGPSLYSAAAWQDWLDYYKYKQNGGEHCDGVNGVWVLLSGFGAHKAAQGQVLSVALEPSELISVSRDEDLAVATHRLIALENGSPLSEGILERSWNRRLARFILPWLLMRPISPNQITIFSFFVGLLAVGGFAHGSYAASVAAALLLPLILVLDCLDGAVARLKFQESPLGAFLDIHGDTVLNLLLFLGIVIGCYRASGQPFFVFLGILIIIGYVACWRLVRPPAADQPAAPQPAAVSESLGDNLLTEATSRDFFYIILIMALLQRLDWLVLALAVGTNIFAWLLYRRQKNGQN